MNINYIFANLVLIHNYLCTCAQDPKDAGLSTSELLMKYGYPFEIHEIQTEDGYLLDAYRLKSKKTKPKTNTSPIMLVHGLMASSDCFLSMGRNSLALLLADEGYDVWLPNCRGNLYSRKHKTLNPDTDISYWFFSWHEIGKYDLPALIDYILMKTKHDQIIYLGHSQGTTVFFVMASERPEYQSKVKLCVLMAPSVLLKHMEFPLLKNVAPHYKSLEAYGARTNRYELIGIVPNHMVRDILKTFCLSSSFKQACMYIKNVVLGNDSLIDQDTTVVMISQFPAGSSLRQSLHYAQLIVSGEFKQYDYGEDNNLKVYNSVKPPKYNLNITTPLAVFYSKNDKLNVVKDVMTLVSILPNVVNLYKVPHEDFSHFDFLFAKIAVKIVYKDVFNIINKYQ